MQTAEMLDFLQDGIARLLSRHGLEEGLAGDEALTFCRELQRSFGGFEHYIPAADKRSRNAAIRADLKEIGKLDEVARKHGLHPSTVSRVARQEDEPDSFGGPDWNL